MPLPTRHKYHAKPALVDGIRFASTAEANRYQVLKIRVATGEIRDLELQPRYLLEVYGVKVTTYVGDFRYRDNAGELVVEDVKGVITDVYKLKRILMLACHGITILEVKAR